MNSISISKLFLFFSLCAVSALCLPQKVYIPAPGPLQLCDMVDNTGHVLQRGVIMQTLMNTRALHSGLQAVVNFDGVSDIAQLGSYQSIMAKLSNVQQTTPLIDEVVAAFECAIMYTYDAQIYLIGGYVPYLSTVVSGLRWRALNPLSYANPWSWVAENNEKGSQLIYEFDQLAKIANQINSPCAARLKVTNFSYKHWYKIRAAAGSLAAIWMTIVVYRKCKELAPFVGAFIGALSDVI
jgi:hypothetical protein